MLAALLSAGVELKPLKTLVAAKTEGNPFFIEEMVQSMFEDRALARNGVVRLVKPLDWIRIPTTVQAVLASRIDRLPSEEKDLGRSALASDGDKSGRLPDRRVRAIPCGATMPCSASRPRA